MFLRFSQSVVIDWEPVQYTCVIRLVCVVICRYIRLSAGKVTDSKE